MKIIGLSTATALAFTVGLLSNVGATIVPAQKGGTCLGAWDTATATANAGGNAKKPWTLDCGDGDPSCDSDGQPNGRCVIGVSACVLQATLGCQLEPLTRFKIANAGRKKFVGLGDPANLANASCGAPGTASLNLRGKKRNRPSRPVTLNMTFKSASGSGKNALRVRCVPPSGGVCPEREASGLPRQITLTVPPEGDDLDTGFTGESHNFPIPEGTQLRYCLSNCNGTDDPTCDASGDTGEGSLNGEAFGAPLPLLSANTPVCVVNIFQPGPITGTFNLSTGDAQSQVNLFSQVYLRSGLTDEVCPRCNVAGGNGIIGSTGQCSATSTTPGKACRVDGLGFVSAGSTGRQSYTLSSACKPTGDLVGSLDIKLPLTTGESRSPAQKNYCPGQTQDNLCGGSQCNTECTGKACVVRDAKGRCIDDKGGISQICCASDATKPCYPTGNNPPESIVRQGSPIIPGSGEGGTFAANFCIPSAGGIVSAVAGLPGPGAMLLPGVPVVTNTP